MITRKEALAAVEIARECQIKLQSEGTYESGTYSIGDHLTMLSAYVARAQARFTWEKGSAAATAELVKIAALAVRAMEECCYKETLYE